MKIRAIFQIRVLITFLALSFSWATAHAKSLAWDLNSDADYYVVYWGSTSGSYTGHSDNVYKPTLIYNIDHLKQHSVYYFAVKAFNSYGNSSDFSSEIVYRPSGTDTGTDTGTTVFNSEGVYCYSPDSTFYIDGTENIIVSGSHKIELDQMYFADHGKKPNTVVIKPILNRPTYLSIERYEFDFNGDGIFEISFSRMPIICEFEKEGDHVTSLKVTDSHGNQHVFDQELIYSSNKNDSTTDLDGGSGGGSGGGCFVDTSLHSGNIFSFSSFVTEVQSAADELSRMIRLLAPKARMTTKGYRPIQFIPVL